MWKVGKQERKPSPEARVSLWLIPSFRLSTFLPLVDGGTCPRMLGA